MPTYDYACTGCGGFDAFRPMASRDEPAPCPDCGAASSRVLTAAPRLALLDNATRIALDTNDRSRHEPKRLRDAAGQRHPSGCGCCGTSGGTSGGSGGRFGGARRGATVTGANGNKAFPSRRPWMISH